MSIIFGGTMKGSQHVSCPVSHAHAFYFQICCRKRFSCKDEISRMLKYQEKFGEKNILVGEIMEFLADLLFFPLRHSFYEMFQVVWLLSPPRVPSKNPTSDREVRGHSSGRLTSLVPALCRETHHA